MPNKALLYNVQLVIIRPIPAAFTIGSRQNFDLRAVDKVGHKVGLTIGKKQRSDGRPRRLTKPRPKSATFTVVLVNGGRSRVAHHFIHLI